MTASALGNSTFCAERVDGASVGAWLSTRKVAAPSATTPTPIEISAIRATIRDLLAFGCEQRRPLMAVQRFRSRSRNGCSGEPEDSVLVALEFAGTESGQPSIPLARCLK